MVVGWPTIEHFNNYTLITDDIYINWEYRLAVHFHEVFVVVSLSSDFHHLIHPQFTAKIYSNACKSTKSLKKSSDIINEFTVGDFKLKNVQNIFFQSKFWQTNRNLVLVKFQYNWLQLWVNMAWLSMETLKFGGKDIWRMFNFENNMNNIFFFASTLL